MKLGFIGLGKMGSRMAEKLLREGNDVVVWNRTKERVDDLTSEINKLKPKGVLESANSVKELISQLHKPRIVWIMLPARSTSSGSETGDATEEILDEAGKYLEKGDILVDGGNAKFSDTQRRYEFLKKRGIKFLGIGVSGGIIAVKEGYPMMAGGDREAYDYIAPILDSLAKPNGGHEYFGEGGAGHFVKMVHNAIEYGYMQSIGEGFGLLEKAPYSLDLVKVANLYRRGSLLAGFMMDRTAEALSADPKMEKIEGVIGSATGETVWAVDEAKNLDLPFEVINRSLEIRNESQTDPRIQKSFAARVVSSLRQAFGGHDVKKR